MRGKLKFKKNNINLFECNILDVLQQLKSLKELSFVKSVHGRSYIDFISEIYNSSIYDEDAALLLPNVRKALKNIVSDADSMAKFKELGATDIDVALIQGNINTISDFAASNVDCDPYKIAKDWRLINLGEHVIQDEQNVKQPFSTIKLQINDTEISLGFLKYTAFNFQNSEFPPKTILINIQSDGAKVWDYHLASEWHNALKPYFDKIVTLGSGSGHISDSDMLNLVNLQEVKLAEAPKMDFALVIINMHDNQEAPRLSKIVKQLPSKLAQETVYLIQSCYAGQYHLNWKADAHLISSSAAEETSSRIDLSKIVNLPNYWQGGNPNLKGLLEFCSDHYEKSNPHFTGSISGIEFNNSPVKDAVTFLYSNEHDSHYVENSLSRSNTEAEFVGLTNLLLYPASYSDSSISESLFNEPELIGNDTIDL